MPVEAEMQGKSLFLDRAVSRSHDWAPRFPALSMACREAGSISRGRQVVVAAADDTGVRCTFFTNLGAVLEFSATWAELEQARTWWHFVRQWNFWIVNQPESMRRIFTRASSDEPTVTVIPTTLTRHDTADYLRYLERVEAAARSTADWSSATA